jgi:hypothetical protein
VPGTVERLLSVRDNARLPTRMRLRVLAGRFSRFTPPRLSPVVVSRTGSPILGGPRGGSPGGGGGGGGGAAGCGGGSDPDNDLLSTSTESEINTNPCQIDTDGDGAEDGFEFKSALDLNNDDYQEPNQSLPYPGKRPYANPLDPSDGGTDYDGDALSLVVEQRLWKMSAGAAPTLSPLTYSDGLQYSIYEYRPGHGDRHFPALAASGYSKQVSFVDWAAANGYRNDVYVFGSIQADLFDFNLDGSESAAEGLHYDRDADGFLSDEERDEDADGLTNYDEQVGRMQPDWWANCYPEGTYYVKYVGTSLTDPDSDGDGVLDGADDVDHDDLPNVMELSRIAAYNDFGQYPSEDGDDRENGAECKLDKILAELFGGQDPPVYHHPEAYGRVNPFNPCLPADSRTCNSYPGFDSTWAPFDQSVDWVALN